MSFTSRSLRLATVLVAGCALTLTACGSSDSADDSSSGDSESSGPLLKAGTLKVCTTLPYEPFEFEKDGEIVGFDMSIADEIAKDLDAKKEVVDTAFESIGSGADLTAKKCDVALAGMTITDERKEAMLFSEPYFDATQALLVKKGSGYSSLDDLKGKKLGVQVGTTGQEYAKKNAGDDVTLVEYEGLGVLTTAVKAGQVDAGINDNGVLFDYVAKNSDTEVSKEFDTGEQYGVGVRKGNDELLKKVNSTLARIKKDGTYAEFNKKWFGK